MMSRCSGLWLVSIFFEKTMGCGWFSNLQKRRSSHIRYDS